MLPPGVVAPPFVRARVPCVFARLDFPRVCCFWYFNMRFLLVRPFLASDISRVFPCSRRARCGRRALAERGVAAAIFICRRARPRRAVPVYAAARGVLLALFCRAAVLRLLRGVVSWPLRALRRRAAGGRPPPHLFANGRPASRRIFAPVAFVDFVARPYLQRGRGAASSRGPVGRARPSATVDDVARSTPARSRGGSFPRCGARGSVQRCSFSCAGWFGGRGFCLGPVRPAGNAARSCDGLGGARRAVADGQVFRRPTRCGCCSFLAGVAASFRVCCLFCF